MKFLFFLRMLSKLPRNRLSFGKNINSILAKHKSMSFTFRFCSYRCRMGLCNIWLSVILALLLFICWQNTKLNERWTISNELIHYFHSFYKLYSVYVCDLKQFVIRNLCMSIRVEQHILVEAIDLLDFLNIESWKFAFFIKENQEESLSNGIW